MKRKLKSILSLFLAAAMIFGSAAVGLADAKLPDFGSLFAQKAEAADYISTSSDTTLYNHTHNYVLTDSYAATCTTDGYKEYTCSCDDKYTTVTQQALGHSFTDYDIEIAHPHYSIYRCSRNGCSEISRTFDTNYDINCSQCNLAPGKATDVTVTVGKSNTATEFKWNAREVAANDINDADYFNVKIYRKESGSYSLYSSEKVNYSLTKLNPSFSIVLPAGSYYAEIVTVCGENISLTSCTDKYYFTVESSIATYTLTYNANGGSTPPSSQSGSTTYTISSIKPTRSGYTFLGWSKSSSATSPSYYAGDSITISANTTLYAVWSINKCGDNLIWTYDEATETLTISGTGDMYDWPNNWMGIPWWSHNDNIKSVVIKNGVTSIGECAFIECQELTSVSIPDSVTNIKRGAFAFCSELKTITIPDSVTEIGSEVFVECINLKNIEIPDGVKTIELSTFSSCSALASVTIPESVTKIGDSAFDECTALREVYYGGSRIGWEAITIENNNTALTNAIVYYAKDGLFTVTWVIDGASTVIEYEPDERINVPNPPSKSGYTFIGWTPEVPETMPDENLIFTAEYKPIDYTIEFVIDGKSAIKEIYTVEGTFNIGDSIRLSDAVITKKDGTKAVLPVIGKENKEQPGGPYKGVDGYKFTGWKVGTQAAFLVDFDITQGITITPEFIESVTFNDKILIKGYWEALSYDFVAYYAKSFDADGNPVYEAMPAVKVKTGANLGDYLAAATETVNANLPEGKRFSLWRKADGSAVPNNMPAYGVEVYANYVRMNVPIYIDYYNFSSGFLPDTMERVIKNNQFSKYLSFGDDIENDIPDNEIISVAEMVRRMTIPDSLKPEGDYILYGWKVYHVHNELDVYYETKWHEGYNDEGTSIAKYPVIYQAMWTDGISGYCGDNLTFVFDKDSGILTVNGTGDMWDWELFNDMPWYKYINDIEFVDISDGVTSIGDNAFYNCQELEDVVIPDSVTKIGKSAFHNCSRLKDVIIPEGVTNIGDDAFYSCSSIKNITIPYGITSIGYRTFYLCNNLKSITIPVTVTSIGNNAFAFCNKLTDVYYEGSKADWNKISIEKENDPLLKATVHFATCNHNFVPSISLPATCTEDGVMTYTCECGDSFTEEIPATGHVPGSWVIVVEPTTEDEGSKIKCCDVCGDLLEEESIPKLPPKEPVADKNVVKTPSTSTISYGDSIILHVDESKIPEGGYVEWSVDNGNFSYKPNGATCTITPQKNGSSTITATIYDEYGDAIFTDEQVMTSKAGFFDKIIAFFKGIFGLNKTYPNVFKGIF